MNKKILAVAAVLAVFGIFGASAKNSTSLGLQAGYNPAGGWGPAITFKVASLPCVFAADVGFTSDAQLSSVGVTADWWIANPRLAGMLNYYYGPGVAVAFHTTSAAPALDVDFRAVAGLNIFPINFLELYAQVAWQPGIYIPFYEGSKISFSWWSLPINAGFRFWF